MATQQSISQSIGQSKLIAVSFPAPQDSNGSIQASLASFLNALLEWCAAQMFSRGAVASVGAANCGLFRGQGRRYGR